MFTGIPLKNFLLSILKFLEADSTEWKGNDNDGLNPGLKNISYKCRTG